MSKKVISLLLLSSILISGCTNSKAAVNETSEQKKSVAMAPKASNSSSSINSEKQTNNKLSEVKGNVPASSNKETQLNETEKAKVEDKVNAAINSINSGLNSMTEAKELDLN